MARSTFSRVEVLTLLAALITRETVTGETPARLATSWIVVINEKP
jgi:hypothetical protein